MAEQKHTPGPWGLMPSNPLQITEMTGRPFYFVEVNGNNFEQAKADARLIAAAPELLEACRAAEWNSLDLPRDVVDMLRAAIAKAEGKVETGKCPAQPELGTGSSL